MSHLALLAPVALILLLLVAGCSWSVGNDTTASLRAADPIGTTLDLTHPEQATAVLCLLQHLFQRGGCPDD